MRAALLVLTVSLVAGTTGAAAQADTCDLLPDPNRNVQYSNQGTPFEMLFITNAVFVCGGDRRIAAQNATYSVAAGQITLTGAVHVEEPEQVLTSEFAQYFIESRQLLARTNVVLTAKKSGSVITSEQLDVYEQSPERPEGLLIATGGRPRAVLNRVAEDGARDSTIVDAREIRIVGEQSFRATGDAVMRRDSVTAVGDAIEYAQERGQLDVLGSARIEMPRQELRGDTITATIDDQDEIRDVLARHGAALHAEELDVTAPAIRLLFTDGGVSRMVAMGWEPAPGAPAGEQPRVVSDLFRMNADSIDVLAPAQQITDAVAVGNAYGERVIPDSLRALLPEAAPEVAALFSSDWMRGDTVRARFAPNPRAETDTTADATIVEQLTAHGDQAQSMYSVRDEDDPAAKMSFNYLVSSYIEVNFAEGVVSTVSAAGKAKGVYIQPADAARAAGANPVGMAAPPRRR